MYTEIIAQSSTLSPPNSDLADLAVTHLRHTLTILQHKHFHRLAFGY